MAFTYSYVQNVPIAWGTESWMGHSATLDTFGPAIFADPQDQQLYAYETTTNVCK